MKSAGTGNLLIKFYFIYFFQTSAFPLFILFNIAVYNIIFLWICKQQVISDQQYDIFATELYYIDT